MTLVDSLYAFGDLTGDGVDEAAVLLTETSGGSGVDVPEGVEITATFSAGRVTGSAGCNRYFAGVERGGPPGFRDRRGGGDATHVRSTRDAGRRPLSSPSAAL